MKHISQISITIILIIISNIAISQELYFRVVEKDKDIINTIITQTVSIDGLVGDTVYAFANKSEFQKIKSLGFAIEELPLPSFDAKSIVMATSINEMANWDRYPTYQVYRQMIKKFEQDYPDLCKLDSIGTTVEGRKLYVVKISNSVKTEEAKPEFFYTSTMHGDETTGFVLMLRLIDYLLSNYGVDDRVNNIVNNISIYINPNANPDGSYRYGNHTVSGSTRYNANGIDLNRNFPYPISGGATPQPETVAMINFAENRNFALSANFHGGIELANFPWDTWTSSVNPHADHNWFYTISRQYADLAQANSPPGYFTANTNGGTSGVAHGGDWFVVYGSRQDYMNYWHHCREITLEISNTKNPSSSLLPNFWNYNKDAMLTYMELVFNGIKGKVTNSQGEPLEAIVLIDDHDKYNSHVKTNPQFGNYLRMIEPGTWNITYSALGYHSQTHTIQLQNYSSSVTKNVVLLKEKFPANFIVSDGEIPIEGVYIAAYNYYTKTNAEGEATLYLPSGTHRFTASKSGYETSTGSITIIDEAVSVYVTMEPSGVDLYSVAFIVTDGHQPISNASITFNENNLSTNVNGEAIFNDIPANTYLYFINAEGFQPMEGEVLVDDDKTLEIELSTLSSSNTHKIQNWVRVWPNPFNETLRIELQLSKRSMVSVEVFDIGGKKVTTIVNSEYNHGVHLINWAPDILKGSSLVKGIYFLRIRINYTTEVHKILFAPTHR